MSAGCPAVCCVVYLQSTCTYGALISPVEWAKLLGQIFSESGKGSSRRVRIAIPNGVSWRPYRLDVHIENVDYNTRNPIVLVPVQVQLRPHHRKKSLDPLLYSPSIQKMKVEDCVFLDCVQQNAQGLDFPAVGCSSSRWEQIPVESTYEGIMWWRI